mmetsp:Transcript_63628/g.75283  ORF Transcript_63628/g.75283 Transcript_63628/m.75283 type:complete len:280 (-) Transcript_63628:249-1088(-)
MVSLLLRHKNQHLLSRRLIQLCSERKKTIVRSIGSSVSKSGVDEDDDGGATTRRTRPFSAHLTSATVRFRDGRGRRLGGISRNEELVTSSFPSDNENNTTSTPISPIPITSRPAPPPPTPNTESSSASRTATTSNPSLVFGKPTPAILNRPRTERTLDKSSSVIATQSATNAYRHRRRHEKNSRRSLVASAPSNGPSQKRQRRRRRHLPNFVIVTSVLYALRHGSPPKPPPFRKRTDETTTTDCGDGSGSSNPAAKSRGAYERHGAASEVTDEFVDERV